MARQRPFALVLLGILHLLGGGLGLTMGLCGNPQLLVTRMFRPPAPPAIPEGLPGKPFNLIEAGFRLQEAKERTVPAYRVFFYTNLVLSFLLDFLLIVAGIGLLCMRPWGRGASVLYVVLSIVWRAAYITYQFSVVAPAMGPILETEFRDAPSSFLESARLGGTLELYGDTCFRVLTGIYPLTVFYVLIQPWVGQAFLDWERAGKQEAREEEERHSAE